ncbi:MAG: 16S rRNA (adenine(1518)-N(6)/adenine(1519)-N(6))-dimethyltransferase RsmA [Candidatus Ornithospirochaeta sp.]|nr:16S rRNA (adenine(1518)-N(6)/adenine(1519)-N(6))-dimethyltransferase RsmA [Sphaerochaetaceae bacterium]MDY5522593.1 16S rRNA (adenine(1518)-N(6)/adenine(1519)-N(6))-dimethyltransferase RsmA [Candidatus Ornithospirochaeta sp.]
MWNLNYDSPKEIERVLSEKGLAMTKKFGQNFLVSPSGREKLVKLMDLEEGMKVWEIGPGLGAITHMILKENVDLYSFEIDHGFASLLSGPAFGDESRFALVEGDALKTLFKKRLLPLPDRIVGNLPYNVGSVMIAKLIENSYLPPLMVFTLQKEVVDRMTAKTGEDDYSSFSVLTQIDYENKLMLKLPRGCFWPQPNVDSAVVVMKRREKSLVDDTLRPVFIPLLRDIFQQRRKTIRNNLISSEYGNLGKDKVEEILSLSGLSGNERAEALSWDSLLKLSESAKEIKSRC